MRTIKTALISLFMAICCLFCCVACDKPTSSGESSVPTLTVAEVSGTYNFYEIVVNSQSYKVGDTLAGQTLQTNRMVLTLNQDKTFHLSEKKYANKDAKEKSGAWSVEGNEITLTVKGTEFLTGELNGTTLTFESAGQKTVLKK